MGGGCCCGGCCADNEKDTDEEEELSGNGDGVEDEAAAEADAEAKPLIDARAAAGSCESACHADVDSADDSMDCDEVSPKEGIIMDDANDNDDDEEETALPNCAALYSAAVCESYV